MITAQLWLRELALENWHKFSATSFHSEIRQR